MTITAGTKLGRYEVCSKIGAGGMGEVYLAHDTRLERTVALKILPANVAADRQRMHRFIQEAKTASSLNHPNILTIFEVEQVESTQFIATEFIDGETLRQHLNATHVKITEALDLSVQVASALSAAHAAGIIHRDIKPENIMLRHDGIVKVLDFGLAKLTAPQPATVDTEAATKSLFRTDAGTVLGTALYMSPEQARGLQVDAGTDIFSLGVLIYEMVAGRLPFEGLNSNEILASILSDKEALPLARYAREVPAELERIVAKALRKDRDKRYQTSKDLLIDLKSLREELEFERKRERSAPSNSESAARGASHADHETVIESAARPTAGEARWTSAIKAKKRSIVVAVAGLLVIASAAVAYVYFTGARSRSIDSVAVLPFVNTSKDPNTEYLSDGITDTLINSLSQLPNLKVMSRNSVFRYKGKETDAKAVGQELGVRAVLTGRLSQRGDNLSISVELVDARDNTQLWGQQYNRKLADILSTQTEMAREISERLRLRLIGEDEKRLAKRYTENSEAYQLYLKGRFYWNKRAEVSVRKGIEYFNQATEVDPNYSLAYTGLADSYNVLGILRLLPPGDAYPKAKAAAKKALEIDDSLAEAHVSLARIMADYDWDFVGAEREYKRAIELNANYPTAHHWYDILLSCNGRHAEALAEAKRAQELDPLSIIITSNVGWVQFNMGQLDQAIEQQRKSLELEPNFVFALDRLGEFYEFKGLYEEAVEEYLKARTHSGMDPEAVRALREAYEQSGMKGYWSKRLEQFNSQQGYVSPFSIAEAYTRLGNKDKAFEWLQKALENRDIDALKVNPMLESLRSDPRFTSLLHRVGLAQ